MKKNSDGVDSSYVRAVVENSTSAANSYIAFGEAAFSARLDGVLVNPNEPLMLQVGSHGKTSVIFSAGAPIISIAAVEW